jgi:small-conductance mechanosensitive channel
LAVWLDEPMLTPKVTSELRFLIWNALAAHNIEIPFPQRDLHIKNELPAVEPLAQENDESRG